MEQTVSLPAPLDSAPIVKKAIGLVSSNPRWTRPFLLSALILLTAGCGSEPVPNDLRDEGDFFQPDRILGEKVNSKSQANNPKNTGICEITKQQKHMLTLVNQARSEARSCGETYYEAAPSLTWNCQLRDAAIAHTKDMMANNFFAHSGSDGLRAGDRITATGYSWRYYGENLAAGYTRSEDALAGLLESPGHCKNIMNPNVIEFGSYREFVENLDYQSYWTHVFAKPM